MKNYKKPQLFKTLGILVALYIFLALPATAIAAASYPSKPVRLIIPYPPGGGAELVARPIAIALSERLGKQVVVDNHGGAGGVIGTEIVARAVPDGYTLLATTSTHTLQPVLQKLPYDPVKSFTPIVKMGRATNALVVHPSVPANSVKELIALMKQKPGQLIFVSAGVGGAPHMATELFKIMTDTDFKIVQFKGGGPAATDLLGGHSHAMIVSLLQEMPHIKDGAFRVLGIGGAKRSAALPDVPTIAEDVPGYESGQWWGIFGPSGMPAPIVDRLNKELKAILASDETKKRLLSNGAEVDYLGPTEFATFLEKDVATWVRVAKMANIKLEK